MGGTDTGSYKPLEGQDSRPKPSAGAPLAPCGKFDFVCSGSGVEETRAGTRGVGGGSDIIHNEDVGAGERARQVGFDRVCALKGEVVHIFTFFHDYVGTGTDGDSGRSKAGELCSGWHLMRKRILSGCISVRPCSFERVLSGA